MEQWKLYSENVSVSDLGRVRIVNGENEVITAGSTSEYRRFGRLYVHRMVAEAFCEKKPGCDVVNHLNGKKWDNRAINLEWTDYVGNNRHAFESGIRTTFGEGHWKSTDKEFVHQIYALKKEGKKVKDIKHLFPLTRKAIQQIYSGENWRYEYEKFFGEKFKAPGIAKGANSHNSIAESKVLQIYQMKKEGKRVVDIAKAVNEKYNTVKAIFNGINWRHLYKQHFELSDSVHND